MIGYIIDIITLPFRIINLFWGAIGIPEVIGWVLTIILISVTLVLLRKIEDNKLNELKEVEEK